MESNTNAPAANPFAQPDKGALPVDRVNLPTVEYSTLKTPATFVKQLTKEILEGALADFKLGFHFWDKEQGAKVRIDGFTFVVLEVYSQLSGQQEIGPKQYQNYYSNKVKDTRTEAFALFMQGNKKPIGKGFYKGKSTQSDYVKLMDSPAEGAKETFKVPDGVGFNQIFVIYWIEGERLLNLRLSTMVSREIKEAIAQAERSTGRNAKPESVKLFGLADTGHLWGFKFNTYRRADKDGTDYKSGDLYFVPMFYAGVVKPDGPNGNPDLHQKCIDLQIQIREDYKAAVERRKQYGDESEGEQGQNVAAQGGDPSFPTDEYQGNHNQGRTLPGNGSNGNQAANPPLPLDTPPVTTDDLPF